MADSEKKLLRRRYFLGVLAVSFFVIHATFHATHGRPWDILWNCTLSNLLVGIGLFFGSARAVAVGASWLCMGNITWLADVFTGGEFFATSVLTHFGGLTVSILGARILGWPRLTFLWATGGLLLLQLLCRLFTPAAANVNLAFSVYAGWERIYSSYRVFWVSMFVQAVLVYFLVDRMFGWLLRPKRERSPTSPSAPL
jgi:hypothetical protein